MKCDMGDVLFHLEQSGMNGHLEAVRKLLGAVQDITDKYNLVASGESRGAGGCFYADGKGTLNAVQIDVEHLEELARKILQRTHLPVRRTARRGKGSVINPANGTMPE